jgi:dTDP-3-amino-3,4,6-trideoxy-alpha-D-glucose transaminase
MASHVRLTDIQAIHSDEGMLGVIEASRQIGFAALRAYFIMGVPERAERGGHAHKRLRQCFVCLRGQVTVDITCRGETESFTLGGPEGGPEGGRWQALQLEAGCWRVLRDMTPDTIVLVMASDEYDEGDYIRDLGEFAAWEEQQAATIPYIDLRRYEREVPAIDAAVVQSVRAGHYIGGETVTRFEHAFAELCGAAGAVGVGNGLDALAIALRARDIGAGDEVIVPAHTFIATALAVDAVGATPVLVDVEGDTGLLDVALVEAAITERTRAVIPVHLYGHPVDMDALAAICTPRGLFLLEDAAQAHGALYKGRPCGGLGDMAAFSFYPTKNLGAMGDAGGVVSSDGALLDWARSYANYGAQRRYHHDIVGSNSRLDPMQAAVLLAKLPYLGRWNERRRALADRYRAGLAGVPWLKLPAVRAWAEPVWHVFPVQVPAERRAAAIDALTAAGIGSNIHYPVPIHRQACYAGRFPDAFPVADRLTASVLSLPLDPTHSDDEIDRVIDAIRAMEG